MEYSFTVVIEKDQDGYYAFCAELDGCYTQGVTYEDVVKNIEDAIRLHVDDRLEAGEPITQYGQVSLTTLKVAV